MMVEEILKFCLIQLEENFWFLFLCVPVSSIEFEFI